MKGNKGKTNMKICNFLSTLTTYINFISFYLLKLNLTKFRAFGMYIELMIVSKRSHFNEKSKKKMKNNYQCIP